MLISDDSLDMNLNGSFLGGRFFVFISDRVPWVFFGIGKWKCPNRPPPIPKHAGNSPYDPWRENIGKKWTSPKNSPVEKFTNPKNLMAFCLTFKQPLQTTDENSPTVHWSHEASMNSSSFHSQPRQRPRIQTPTGGITGCHGSFQKKKWQNGCIWPKFDIFVVRRFCYWKKRAATAMTLVEVNKKNHYKEKASNFQSIPIQV